MKMGNYPICTKCNKRMVMDKMGVTTRVNKEYLQDGDRFRCPECGYKVVTNYGEPYEAGEDSSKPIRYDGMGKRDMQMETLEPKERKLLLKILDIEIKDLKCDQCGDKVDYKKCCIFPALEKSKKLATITCDSPMCISEYLEEADKEDGG